MCRSVVPLPRANTPRQRVFSTDPKEVTVQLDGWIDVHAHFYTPESEEKREASLKAMQQACWCTKRPPSWDPNEILAYMDRRGVQLQLLSNKPWKGETNTEKNTSATYAHGARVLVTSRRTAKIARLKQLGSAEVIDTN